MKRRKEPGASDPAGPAAQDCPIDKDTAARSGLSHEEALALLHELRERKDDLERENRELRQACDEAEARVERRAEDLRSINDRLASVLDSITDCHFALDAEWRFTEVNPAAERLVFHRPATELLGRNIWEEYSQGIDSEFHRQYRLAIAEQRPVHFEGQSFLSRGRWFEGHAHPQVDRLEIYLRDISGRKQAEEALRDSEGRYRALFESMSEGFALHHIICDEDGAPVDYRFLDVNPAFERLTGLSRDSVIGKTVLEVMPDTEPRWIKAYGQVALTGEPASFEEYSGALGKHYSVHAYSPEPLQFAVLFVDMTDRKQAEAQQEAFYRHTIQAATQGKLAILDRDEVRAQAGAAEKRWDIHSPDDISVIRRDALPLAESAGMDLRGLHKMVSCIVEGCSNVLKHARSGHASLHRKSDAVFLLIEDEGPGIAAMRIPDVALLRGYSTAGTLGMGYKVMIASCRKLYLATGTTGTTVGIEISLVNRDLEQTTVAGLVP